MNHKQMLMPHVCAVRSSLQAMKNLRLKGARLAQGKLKVEPYRMKLLEANLKLLTSLRDHARGGCWKHHACNVTCALLYRQQEQEHAIDEHASHVFLIAADEEEDDDKIRWFDAMEDFAGDGEIPFVLAGKVGDLLPPIYHACYVCRCWLRG